MRKLEYRFKITRDLLGQVLDIAENGSTSYAFIYDLRKLYEESELTPNKDMSWYLSRLISTYYSPQLMADDNTFSQINDLLLKEWQKSLPESVQDEYKKLIFKNSFSVNF